MGEHHAGTTFCNWLFCHADGHWCFVAGIIAALIVATAFMFLGGMLALMIKLLPWLLLAVAVVWVIRAIKAPKVPKYQHYDRWRY